MLGYDHEIVRSSAKVGEDLLPQCHRVASLLKRWLLGTHQGAVRHQHLAYYLDEFTFRFKSSHFGISWETILSACSTSCPDRPNTDH